MRILELIECLGPGGAQRFVVDLSNELSLNNEVAIGTFIDRTDSKFYEGDLNKNVFRFDNKIKNNWSRQIRQTFSSILYIHKFKPDIVHVHDRAFVPSIIPSILFPKIKFFYTVHNVASKDAGKGFGAKLKKYFLKRTIKPIAISNYCALSFKEYYGYPATTVIENGCRLLMPSKDYDIARVEINRYKKTPETKVFLNIARFAEQKNHELLIKSFNRLISTGYDISLIIIGNSESAKRRSYLESLIEDKSRIIFIGSKHNVQDYLLSVDYFCLSSSWEGLPITILEAGLCGCFTVSTPVGGVPDVIINEKIGVLSVDITTESYCDALIKAYELKPYKDEIAYYYSEKYTMKECAKKYLKAFISE